MLKELELIKKNWFKTSHVYSEVSKSFGVDSFELKILNVILLLKDNCTQKNIAETINVPKQTVNNVIKNFANLGLIELKPNKKDKRQKLIILTDKGMKLCENTVLKFAETEEKVLSEFTIEEINQFIKFYTKYNELLEKEVKEVKE